MAKRNAISTTTRKEISREIKLLREAIKADSSLDAEVQAWNIYLLIRDGANQGVNA